MQFKTAEKRPLEALISYKLLLIKDAYIKRFFIFANIYVVILSKVENNIKNRLLFFV
jgi:hypothetical protein